MHRGPDEERRDQGVTLVELAMAMSIFLVVMSVFVGGIVIMTRGTARSQVTTYATDDARVVFERLDKTVRYAEAINYPGTGAVAAEGRQYVEFRIGATESANGKAMCTQWRYDPGTGSLQRRTWEDAAGVAVPEFTTVVNDVAPAASGWTGGYPFRVLAATTDAPHQRLAVRLRIGKESVADPVESSSTFVARNSSKSSLSNLDANGDGTSDVPVCLSVAGRP
jgi:prepilin-type N-terminal cleavage/methylation domain-containing protein